MSSLAKKINTVLSHPVNSFYHFLGTNAPDFLFNRYASLSRKSGIDKLYLILSFDCDTEEDINAAWDVHRRLQGMGISPVYAVPGDLLRRGEKVYRRIYESGSQFINHGDIEHTFYDIKNKRYASCFFYNEQSFDRIKKDIFDGHRTLKEVLNIEARGFRTPHFGTFQSTRQLKFLYGVLKELGYLFSTSTAPIYGLRGGAMINSKGIIELPVSGTIAHPLQVLDSWGYFKAPARKFTPEDYLNEAKKLSNKLADSGVGIINIYADPSHVYKQELFFQAINEISKVAVPITYNELPGLKELI